MEDFSTTSSLLLPPALLKTSTHDTNILIRIDVIIDIKLLFLLLVPLIVDSYVFGFLTLLLEIFCLQHISHRGKTIVWINFLCNTHVIVHKCCVICLSWICCNFVVCFWPCAGKCLVFFRDPWKISFSFLSKFWLLHSDDLIAYLDFIDNLHLTPHPLLCKYSLLETLCFFLLVQKECIGYFYSQTRFLCWN